MNNVEERNIGFSVIVPAFNAEKTIEKCLYSIIEQKYTNFEVIIINDGSTDETKNLVNDIQLVNKNLHIYSINNSGVSRARNFGLSKASKEYIVFVDADDYIGSDYLSRFAHNLGCEDLFIVSTFEDHRIKIIDERFIGKVLPTEQAIGELDSKEILGYLHGKCFKREIIKKNGIHFRDNISFCEDLLFIQDYIMNVNEMFIFKGNNYHYSDSPDTLSKRSISNSQAAELIKSISSSYSFIFKRYPSISKELKENMNRRLVNVFFLFLFNPSEKLDFESFELVQRVARDKLIQFTLGSGIKVAIKILFTKLNAKLSWCFFFFYDVFKVGDYKMKGFLIFLYILIRKLFSLVYNPKIERDIKSNYIVKSAEVVPIVRNPIPKVIWMYWDDPNVPDLVLQCFFNISKYNPRYKVHLLNAVTINDFIDIKFSSSVEINPAHKSDLIRLCLLSKYGGVWIDATTIMFEDISWVQNIYKYISVDFVGYYHRKSTINYDRPVIENWFMASPIESKFISMWLNELMVILEKGSSGLYEDISNSADFSDIKQNIHNPSYMVTYLLQQRVQKKVGLSFYLKCAEDEAFLIQENNNWKSYKTAVDLSIKNNTGLNIIKLTSLDRFYVNKILARNMQCKSSIIGRLINEC